MRRWSQASANLGVGVLADTYGRRWVEAAGWVVGLLVPFLVRAPAPFTTAPVCGKPCIAMPAAQEVWCRCSGDGGGGSWAGAWWASGSELVVWCLLSIFSPFIPFGRSNPISILSSTAGGEPLATTHFD